MQTSPADSTQQAEPIDVRKILYLLYQKWYWIALGAIVGTTLAFLYLRYTPALFQATTTLRIESDELGLYGDFADLAGGVKPNDKLLTEVEILKSRSLIEAAIAQLPLKASYFSVGSLTGRELYKRTPFRVEVTHQDSLPYGDYFTVKLDPKRLSEFLITATNHEIDFKPQTARFGDWISISPIKFRLIRIDSIPLEFDKYRFCFNKTTTTVERVRENFSVKQPVKEVSLIEISIKDAVPDLTADFVNTLSKVYIEQDVSIKAQAASQTLNFIDNLLTELSLKVHDSGLQLEKFKRDNQIVDVTLKTQIGLERVSNQEVQHNMLEIQRIAILNLEKQLRENQEVASLNFNLEGNVDPVLTSLITTLNQLNAERRTRLQTYTPESPYLQEIDQKILEVKRSIQQNINIAKKRIEEQILLLNKFIKESTGNLSTIPEAERMFINLLRDYEVNQKVYGILMEKRLEQSIVKASVVSSARVVDLGLVPEEPISPSKKVVYLLGLIAGIGAAVFILLLADFLNDRIDDPNELERLNGITLIGILKSLEDLDSVEKSYSQTIINQRSALSESLRALRTNIQFVQKAAKKPVIISTTSSISGEGKSFITLNLAAMFSLLGKKVIILELDLRKPKLYQRLNLPNDVGMSNCLAGQCEIQAAIRNTEIQHLDIILSGPIPPNPAELILGDQFPEIIAQLSQQYDYIFIDTPPVGLVSDAIPLLKISDVCLYIFRHNRSLKSFAQIPKRLKEEHDLPNLYCVLNGFSAKSGSYGYYGYYGGYYGQYNDGYFETSQKKTFGARLKKLFSFKSNA